MKPRTNPFLRSALLFATVAFGITHRVQAQSTYYWDNNGGTAGFGTAAGTWAAPTTGDATQGWSTDAAGNTVPVSVTTGTNDSINFGTATVGLSAGTITVSGTVDSGNITFGSPSGAIILSGGIVNLAATSTITVNNTSDTISSKISGAGTSLTKAGNGTLTLSGDNTFSGGLNFSAGALNINSNTALGTAALAINSGGTIDNTSGGLVTVSNNMVSTVNTTIGGSNALTTTGSYTYNNNNRVLQVNGSGAFTVGTLVTSNSGSNPLRKRGSGTLAITGAWTSGAGIEMEGGQNAGTVLIGDKLSLGTGSLVVFGGGGSSAALKASTTLTGANKIANAVNLAGALTLGGSFDFEMGGVISSTGSLTKSDANTVILSGANTYSGTTTVSAGTLKAGGASVANTSGAFGLNSAVSLANTAGVVLDLNGNSNTIGSLSGGGSTGGTVALGASTLKLNMATNTIFSGAFTGSGTLELNATGAATSTFTYNGASGTVFTGTVDVKKGILLFAGNVHDALSTTLDGAKVVIASGAQAKADFGFNGAYNNRQTFVINGTGADGFGALQILGLRYGGAGIGGLAVASDATFATTDNGVSTSIAGLAGTGTLTLSGAVSGTTSNFGNIAIGTAAKSLAGYSAFNGNLNLRNSVTLNSNVADALGTASGGYGNVDLADGTKLNVGASQTIGGLTDTTATVYSDAVALGGNILTIGHSTTNLSGAFRGVISGTGGLTKAGTGILTLSGANTYSGATTVNAGTLKAGVASVANTSGAFGLNSAISLANTVGVILDLNGNNNTIGSLSGGGTTGGTVALGANNLTIKATTNSQTYSGLFTGPGSIIVDATTGTNVVIFGGGNTAQSGTGFTGNVSVNSGTLEFGKTHNVLGTNASTTQTVVVASGAAVNFANGNAAFGQSQNFVINGTGTVAAGNAALSGTQLGFGSGSIGGLAIATNATVRTTLNTSTDNFGVNVTSGLVGTGKLTKIGNGYLYLNAAAPSSAVTWAGTSYSGFTGDVDVTGGVIQLASVSHVLGTNTAGTQLVTISSGAALVMNAGNGAYTNNQNFVLNGAGTGQAANLGGLAALELSNVNFGNEQIRGIAVATNSTISVNRNSSAANTIGLDVNGPLAGTGTLTVTSTSATTSNSTLYLKAAAGTVGSYSAFTGNVNVRNGARLASNNATALGSTANVDLADGTVLSIGADQTLGGLTSSTAVTNTGSVLLNSRTLTIGSTNNLSSSFSGVISNGSGAGGIIKAGNGTLTLTGTNTYTGTTGITAGTLQLDGSTSSSSTVNIGTAGTLTGSGTVNGNATLTGSGIINKSSGTISGTLGVTGGSWNGAGTVAGAVTSSSGIFTIGTGANLTASNGVSVTGGTLTGTGTVTGNVTIGATAKHNAGGVGTVDTQTVTGDLTYAASSIFDWDLQTSSTTTGFDKVSTTGALSVGANAVFNVILGGSAQTDLANPVNAFWNTPNSTKVWNMSDIFGSGFASNAFTSVTSTANPTTQGAFTITGSGATLTWTAVPEPTSALVGLLVGARVLRRRRGC